MWTTVYLNQNDFDTGTYRIKTSFTKYILAEQISFNPTLTRADLPLSGFWFAAITVETNNVIIDLNGYEIEQSREYFDKNLTNVYSNIECANSPYPGGTPLSFGQNGVFAFKGDTQYISANNVVIENGCIGRSGHWGIHYNNDTDVMINNIVVKQFAVGGIVFNNGKNPIVNNVKIIGWQDEQINVTGITTAIFLLTRTLAAIPGDASKFYLDQLNAFLLENPNFDGAPINYPDGSYSGIGISSGIAFAAVDLFPTTPDICAILTAGSNGGPSTNIKMDCVSIEKLTINAAETVTIDSRLLNVYKNHFIPLAFVRQFGVLRWIDAYKDKFANFAPNAFLQAQAFVGKVFLPASGGILPANTSAIFDAILSKDETKFLAQAQPGFGRNFNLFINRGVFGIRLDCASKPDKKSLCRIRMKDILSIGPIGKTLNDIAKGDLYKGIIEEVRYEGNDAWHIELSTDDNVELKCSEFTNLVSENGFVFSTHLATHVSDSLVRNLKISNLSGNRVASEDDIVNPSSDVYGVFVQHTEGTNLIENVIVRNLSGAGEVVPYAAERAPNTKFRNVSVNPDCY